MKKLLIGLFCATLLLSMTACGEEEKASTETTAPADTVPSISDSTTPTDEDATTSATESGDTTGTEDADGTTGKTDGTTGKTDGTTGKTDGTTGKTDGTTGKTDGTTGKTDGTTGKTDGTQDGTTNCVVSDPTKSTGTTKKPTTTKKPSTTKKPTGTQAQVSDNVADWEDTFGKDEPTGTTGKQEGTTTTKKPTTTTTTKPTTTTTLKPTTIEQVSLPAVGTDVDGRGRIFLSAISLKSGVMSVTISNKATNWITEETDYVTYACYDKNGKQLKSNDDMFGYLYLGSLEVGEEVSFNVTLPAGTARVELTGSKIVYWTPWKK